jgi:hypothetical protein
MYFSSQSTLFTMAAVAATPTTSLPTDPASPEESGGTAARGGVEWGVGVDGTLAEVATGAGALVCDGGVAAVVEAAGSPGRVGAIVMISFPLAVDALVTVLKASLLSVPAL